MAQIADPYEQDGFSDNHSSDENDESNAAKLPLEIQLIKHIAREQALYNPKHEFYRNSVRKDEKWLKIGAGIGWSEAQCKAKWKAFRDQYCRELKRSKKNPKATVKWKYFKYLEFLRPFALSRNYRPRYVPTMSSAVATNPVAATLAVANNNHDYKMNNSLNTNNAAAGVDSTDASLITSDFSLLQSIKLEPQTQSDEQQKQFRDNCAATLTANSLNNATTQHNIKNETIVVIAAEQFNNLNNVYQHSSSQHQQQHQQQQQQHIESWSFLTSTTTTTANSLLNQQQTTRQTPQQRHQQQISNGSNNVNTSTNTNLKNNFNYIHNTSNSDSTADADACLYSAFANCVAEADAAAVAMLAATTHENNSIKNEQQLKSKPLPIFMPPPTLMQTANANTMTTITPDTAATVNNNSATSTLNEATSDEEDDDSIHTFLNIESYFEKELIANVQSEDILYNNFHPNYRNVKLKLDVWAEIARKMKKTVKQCRLKWKALRDQYIREHKRLRNRENIESVPRWKHYDALNFLHKFIKHKNEIEEKQIFHLLKTEIELGEELMIRGNGAPSIMQHLNDAQVKQRQTANDMLSETASQTTATTAATTTTTTLVAINDNHRDTPDDYDAMDIDEYIITESSVGGGDSGCESTNRQQLHHIDGNSLDANNDDNNMDGDVNDDDDGDVCLLSNENRKAMNQLHQSYVSNECMLDNDDNDDDATKSALQQRENLVREDFQNLNHMVDMQTEQQQPTATTSAQDESIMHVVGLSDVEDELVVINNASVAQLGFVVTPTTTTPATVSIEQQSQQQQLQLNQHAQQHQQQSIQNQQPNFVSIAKSSPNVRDTLDFYSNHNDNEQCNTNASLNNVNNNNNHHNNNIVSNAHDVGSVLSAIASCGDFTANYNQTNQIVTSISSATESASSSQATLVTSHNMNSTNQKNLPNSVTNITESPTTSTTTATISNTINSTAASNPSTVSLVNTSALDEDEVGTFFHSITMKVRSLNLSPVEFTDLQIEVLRVINRSIRKN